MSGHAVPPFAEEPGFFRLWGMFSAMQFLWLWRHKWLAYPIILVEIAGLGLMAYGAIRGTDIFMPLGYGAGDYQFALTFVAFLITMVAVLPAVLFPLLRLGGLVVLLGGVGLGIYEIYSWLRTGMWPGYSLHYALGGITDLAWLDDRSDWVGLKAILSFVLRWTPLSLALIALGLKWCADAVDPRNWREIVADYRRLQSR
jgi:hypothetical protein